MRIYDLNNNFQRSNDFTYKTKGNIKEFENKNDKSEIIETGKRIFNKDELICEISEFKGFSIDSLIYSNKKIVKEISVNLKTGKRNIYENKYDTTGRLIERIVQMIVFE